MMMKCGFLSVAVAAAALCQTASAFSVQRECKMSMNGIDSNADTRRGFLNTVAGAGMAAASSVLLPQPAAAVGGTNKVNAQLTGYE